ncbi:Gfo/Idh/MocA family oxidoreductase [Arthrobacter gandavensis]|uniref:Gfo/Idh/MocA family protein n=1 Tax=Arthrobacter gandavensis TaxID=169960 RepID=UPI00188E5CF5|nr:Gfo/Idh/MocA family oxidoreductase [Arthrobacter gandavensis]MBF4994462.1 Gfo/Idh/MocA family oxidoreductase [Arthrobacter gandavensis]
MTEAPRPGDYAPLRTLLFGYGLGGRVFHAPLLEADPRYSLDVIVTSDPARAQAAAKAYPGAAVVPSAEAALDLAADLDLAVISTPPATHASLGLAALRSGLHAVVDKPFAHSPQAARELMETAAAAGKVLSVFQNRRWDGDFLTLKGLLERGDLGTVTRFESRMESFKPAVAKAWKREAGTDDGGGILFDLGPHLVDQALQLFGPAKPAYAEVRSRREDGGPDDDVFVVLQHDSGVLSHLWMNSLSPRPGARFRVTGSKAAWTKRGADPQEAQLDAGMLPGDPGYGEEELADWGLLGTAASSAAVPTEAGRYQDFYAGLATAVLDGGALPVDPADSLRGLEIIRQIHAGI